ncbi:MAG: hypothetical protein ABH843_00815 [Candidatus Omnitrophota bacterium]
MFDSDMPKDARDNAAQAKGEKVRLEPNEHRDWVRKELEESKREKKKISGFQNKLKKGFDLRKKAIFGGKFTHGTRGKPTHGPRGNQG